MTKTLSALLSGCPEAAVAGGGETPVRGLARDSRAVREGDCFVAVHGAKVDGHRFVSEAAARGAVAVVVEHDPVGGAPEGLPVVRVPDTRRALAAMAAEFYDHPSRHLALIGVTGTNGKTTTTHLIEGILAAAGARVAVLGTLSYRFAGEVFPAPVTTPESLDLQRMLADFRERGATHAVMEVSSHALSLSRVVSCDFACAVFTNLSRDHLDFHGDMEDYFAAKAALFGPMNKKVVTNLDDAYGRRLAALRPDAATYAVKDPDAHIRPVAFSLTARGIEAELQTPAGRLPVRSPLLGRLNLANILASVGAALSVGVAPDAVSRGLAAVSCVDGRLQRLDTGRGFQVVVDYAHTPDAMEKAIGCLRELARGRVIVVFGCGGDRDRGKRPIMGEIAARLGDVVVVTSDNPRTEDPRAIIAEIEPGVARGGLSPLCEGAARGYVVEPDRRSAIARALSLAREGDVVFIGGKGHETYQIVGTERHPFDDRQVVRGCLDTPH